MNILDLPSFDVPWLIGKRKGESKMEKFFIPNCPVKNSYTELVGIAEFTEMDDFLDVRSRKPHARSH